MPRIQSCKKTQNVKLDNRCTFTASSIFDMETQRHDGSFWYNVMSLLETLITQLQKE